MTIGYISSDFDPFIGASNINSALTIESHKCNVCYEIMNIDDNTEGIVKKRSKLVFRIGTYSI